MPKAEWGTKRLCESCGARFYDFGRAPAICPSCGAEFDLSTVVRPKRTAVAKVRDTAADTEKKAAAAKASEADDEEDQEDAEEESDDLEVAPVGEIDSLEIEGSADGDKEAGVDSDDDDEEEDSPLVEDASELGDDDDMSDVIDTAVDDDAEST